MQNQRWMTAAVMVGTLAVGAVSHAAGLFDDPAPTTQPSPGLAAADEKVMRDLVTELGDENPKVRSQAAQILKRHGKDALAALRAGTRDSNVQVRASSEGLIDRITHPEKFRAPDPVPADLAFGNRHGFRIINGGGMAGQIQIRGDMVQMRADMMQIINNNNGAVREITSVENGRSVRIHEDRNGVAVTVTVEGKVDRFEAKNAEELKTKSPEAYKWYEKYAGNK